MISQPVFFTRYKYSTIHIHSLNENVDNVYIHYPCETLLVWIVKNL